MSWEEIKYFIRVVPKFVRSTLIKFVKRRFIYLQKDNVRTSVHSDELVSYNRDGWIETFCVSLVCVFGFGVLRVFGFGVYRGQVISRFKGNVHVLF